MSGNNPKYDVYKANTGDHVPWPCWVLGARDEAAIKAMEAYLRACIELGYSVHYLYEVHYRLQEMRAFYETEGRSEPQRDVPMSKVPPLAASFLRQAIQDAFAGVDDPDVREALRTVDSVIIEASRQR